MDPWKRKGTMFEMKIAQRLRDIGGATVISQYGIFSYALNRVTAVDVLLTTDRTVVVIECKCVSTELSGTYSQRIWVGKTGGRQYHVFNPIYQVKEKERSLQRLFREKGLDVDRYDWRRYVVVPNGCRIRADRSAVKTEDDAVRAIGELIARA